MGFLTKVTAQDEWEDIKTGKTEVDKELKEYYSKPHRRTDLKKGQKAIEFRDASISLASSVSIFLSDRDECPEDKEMVMVHKEHIKKILEEVKVVKKLKDEWKALEKQHSEQLLGK